MIEEEFDELDTSEDEEEAKVDYYYLTNEDCMQDF